MGLGVEPSNFGSNRTSLEIHSPSSTVSHLSLTNSATGSNGSSNGFNIIQNSNDALLFLRESGNLTFSTNNAERLRITSAGDMGLGTNNPTSDGGTTFEIYNASTPTLRLNDGDDYKALFQLRGNDLEIRGSNGQLEFYTGNADGASSSLRGVITSDGNVEVGTGVTIQPSGSANYVGILTASKGPFAGSGAHLGNIKVGFDNLYNSIQTVSSGSVLHLQVDEGDLELCSGDGDVFVGDRTSPVMIFGPSGIATATQFDATSDVALKENIEVIDEPITKLSELKGVTFDWKAGGHSVGVIAQDVEKVLPTAVGGNKDKKTVNYNAIIGLLVESVKDQQKQIEELKSLLDK